MAATLIHIKSRMLLPVDEEAPGEEEDPRLELIQWLLEYQTFKDASLGLREKEEEWMNIFHREPVKDEAEAESAEPELYLFDVNLFDLIGAFKRFLTLRLRRTGPDNKRGFDCKRQDLSYNGDA